MRPDHRMVAHTGFLTHARLLVARQLSRGGERARPRRPRRADRRGPGRLAARVRAPACSRGRASRSASRSASHFVPRVVTAFGGTSADDRVTVALLFLVLVATLGQALGLGVGAVRAPRAGRRANRCRAGTASRARWSASSACSCSCGCSIPSLATAHGLAGADGAQLGGRRGASTRWRPSSPAQFAAWGRAISDAPYPAALGPLDDPPDPGPPPEARRRPRRSTTRVAPVDREGRRPRVRPDPGGQRLGRRRRARRHERARGRGRARRRPSTTPTARRYDDHRRRVRPGARPRGARGRRALDAPPLALGDGRGRRPSARCSATPAAGRCAPSPVRVGEEIVARRHRHLPHRRRAERDVFVLAASLAPGDSGGAVVDTRRATWSGWCSRSTPVSEGTSLRAHRRRSSSRARPGRCRRRADTGRCLVG